MEYHVISSLVQVLERCNAFCFTAYFSMISYDQSVRTYHPNSEFNDITSEDGTRSKGTVVTSESHGVSTSYILEILSFDERLHYLLFFS